MVSASHGLFSTNWNSGEVGSKRHTSTSDTASVTSVVHNATQRALRFTDASSPPSSIMNSAPTIGRKVVIERIGQLAMSVASEPEPVAQVFEPRDGRRRADQHRERIVVEVAGLQPDGVARHVEHARRDAVGAETVDQPAIAIAPQD